MKLPTLDELLKVLDLKEDSDVCSNMIELRNKYGLDNLVDLYAQAFYVIKNFPARREIAYWVGRYVKHNENVFNMALLGLNDKSYIVRYHCCGIIAFSQRTDSLDHLNKVKDHKNVKTREDIVAAIDSIQNRNHNYFVDREHTGTFKFDLGKINA